MQHRSALALLGRTCAVVALLGTTLSAGISHAAPAKAPVTASKPITLTYWTWDSFAPIIAKMFEKAHPNITVDVVNAGEGLAEYTKLRTAIEAGTGVPDVIDMEFPEMRTFEATDSLLNLSKYGANAIANKFIPWVWGQVSANGQVYGIPEATGQMGMLYRKDIFDKYGIAIPKTWAEFATTAKKLHAADPKIYLTDLSSNDYNAFMGLAWQAGARPFIQTGKDSWRISLDSAVMKKLVNFWGPLIANGSVSTDADYTTQWYQGMSSGKYATWLTAAWGPTFLEGLAKNTSGLWRVAPLPQWSPGADVSSNVGGGAVVASKTTKYPVEATEFLEFLATDPQSAALLALQEFRFPVTKAEANSPAFLNQKVAFFGGQKVNALFAQIAKHVDTNFEWSPFNDFVGSSFIDTVGTAIGKGESDLTPSLQAWQNAVVSYGRKQGFTISTSQF